MRYDRMPAMGGLTVPLPIAFENRGSVPLRDPVWLALPDTAVRAIHRGREVPQSHALAYVRLDASFNARDWPEYDYLEFGPSPTGVFLRFPTPDRGDQIGALAPGQRTTPRTITVQLSARASGFRMTLWPRALQAMDLIPPSPPIGIPSDLLAPPWESDSAVAPAPFVPAIVVLRFAESASAIARQAVIDGVRGTVVGGSRTPDGNGDNYVRLPDGRRGTLAKTVRQLKEVAHRTATRVGVLLAPAAADSLARLRALGNPDAAVPQLVWSPASVPPPFIQLEWSAGTTSAEKQRILDLIGGRLITRDTVGAGQREYVGIPGLAPDRLRAIAAMLQHLPEVSVAWAIVAPFPELRDMSDCGPPPDTRAWPDDPIARFARRFALPQMGPPTVLKDIPELNATIFVVAYGPPSVLDLSCGWPSVFGLRLGDRFGWVVDPLIPPVTGSDSLLHAGKFRFQPGDAWLGWGRLEALVWDAALGGHGWIFVNNVKRVIVADPQTARATLKDYAEQLYQRYDWTLASAMLKTTRVQQDVELLTTLAFVPHGVDESEVAGRHLAALMPQVLTTPDPEPATLFALTHWVTRIRAGGADTAAMRELLRHRAVRRDLALVSMLAYWLPEARELAVELVHPTATLRAILDSILRDPQNRVPTGMVQLLRDPAVRTNQDLLVLLANLWPYPRDDFLSVSRVLPAEAPRRWEPVYQPPH